MAVHKLLTTLLALELALPEEEIPKHAFDAIPVLIVQNHELFHVMAPVSFDKAGRYCFIIL